MTLAVGVVPTAQLPAVPSTHQTRVPTPPPRHCPCRNFHTPRVPPHPYTSLPMEVTPSHLPSSPEVFPNSSPSPPPPPPSYSISELPAADLPPPPPLTVWQEMASPCYMCCYDPPSPEVKSEYDPKLPPGFSSTPDIFPSSPPPPVPPPPRPSPPPPPTPPVRQMSGASPPPSSATTFNDAVDLLSESAVDREGCEDHSVETCSTSSLVSSSTLTAPYFQTPDSALSPLPPHALRVSPLSTDAVTLSSHVSIDSITSSSDVSLTQTFFSASQEHTLPLDTSELEPHTSVLMETFYDASFSPDISLPPLLMPSEVEQQESPMQTAGPYKRMESIKSEDGSSIPSEISCLTNDTAGPAVMSSPLSTDIPSLSSLPTDPDSVSSGFGSLTTDTWSLSPEMDSQARDVSIVGTKPFDSSASDIAYTSTAEREAVSPTFTGSCTITPMPSDYLTPLFSSPAPTPIPSPLPSSPLPYLYKSESPLNSGSTTPQGMVSQEPLQTANGEFSSSEVPLPQENYLEYSSTTCHSFTSPSQSHHCSDFNVLASKPPLPIATKQLITHTKQYAKEISDNTEIISNLTQHNQDNNSPLQRTSYEEETGSRGVPYNTTLLENGQFSEQMTEEEGNDVIEKKEEMKKCSNDRNQNGESTDEQGGKDVNIQSLYEEENHDGKVTVEIDYRENSDSHVVKDVNGNISYLSSEDGHDVRLEDGEDVSESRSQVLENKESQTTKTSMADSTQPTEGAGIHENILSEILTVLSSHSSPVPSSSLAHSPAPCSITPSLPHIPSGDTLHLSLHTKVALVNHSGRDSISPHKVTPSTFTHCSPASPKSEPRRVAQVSSTPKEAMELLNAVVMNLENLSADLPASPTSRSPDNLPSQARPVTILSKADQPVTHIPESSKIPLVNSQDGDPEEPKVEACHLSQSSLILESPPHPTPISPALSSHTFSPTPTMPPPACTSTYCDEASTCVSSLCPSLTTNTVNPAHSVSIPFWDMADPGSDSFPSSSTYGDHTNTTLSMKDNTESAFKEEVLSHSQWKDFQDSFPVGCGTALPSLCSSPKPGSLLDGQPPPSPAPCSRTPPTPPPRSCHSTPRSSLGPPLPPVRQYMLVPINQPLGTPRQSSPPPAPPRSTSVRRASPPPPPRPTAPQLLPQEQEWNKGPPLPPPPVSSSLNPPQPALTPVPEESSNPQSPVLSKSPQLSSPVSEGVPSQAILPPDSLPATHQLPSPTSCSSEDPPALPPPPEDEQEDEDMPPPPPPPPPVESEDEVAPPLPLPPPPPPHVLFSSPSPLSPTPGKGELSTPFSPCQQPALPGLCVAASHTNLSSAPSSDSDLPPPAVDDVAIPPPPKIPNTIASLKSPMPNSQAVDAADASSPPPIPPPPHAPPSSPPLPPCAPGPNMGKAAKSPLITTSPYGKMMVVRSDLPLPTPEEEVRVAFTTAKDWGFLAESEDTLSVYTQLRPVIQQGPQCGLVALSMASQVFPQTVEVEELLAAGRRQGVTQHGEMFCTKALARLAEETVTGVQAEVRRDVLSSPATLLQLLLQGDLVLVPYDAEKNHQPGQMGGHKAHWGVVCGCLVQSCSLTFPTAAAKLDSHVDHLWHLRPRSRAGRSRSVTPCPPTLSSSPKPGLRGIKTLDGTGGSEGIPSSVSCSRVTTPMLCDLRHDDELRLVALWRQGKSRKVVAAPLDQLCESNDQLVSYPPAVTPQEAEYIVGSVQEELAGQVVVLHKTKAALSDLVGLLQEK